jgi:hypothetical protein
MEPTDPFSKNLQATLARYGDTEIRSLTDPEARPMRLSVAIRECMTEDPVTHERTYHLLDALFDMPPEEAGKVLDDLASGGT